MTRSGASAGLAVEDVGVNGDERYDMTETTTYRGQHTTSPSSAPDS